MDEEKLDRESPPEEPEVYTVKKDLDGWRFSRRGFLAAAGTAAAAAALGSVAACNSGSGTEQQEVVVVTATPTETAATSPTPVVVVVTATPTDTPEVPPTPTNTDTPLPTDTEVPTETPSPTPALPKARFVTDVTIPDGSVMEPGQEFTKTWRFQNNGAVAWGSGVEMAFVPGKQKGFDSKQMDGPDSVNVASVAAGKNVDVSVKLTAPKEVGHYRSYWRLRLGNGEWLENPHYADIYVASKAAIEPGKKGIEFKAKDAKGTMVTWTQPCGTPIPPGAVCVCNCVTAELPGSPGTVPAGQNGIGLKGPGGEERWLPCGSPIPAGWVCTCNCVSVPGEPTKVPCRCDQQCGCDKDCSCDTVHYWYPN